MWPTAISVALVRGRDRVYGDCLPKFLQPAIRCVAVTYTRSTRKRCAQHRHEERFGLARSASARQKHIYQGRVGWGWVSEGWRGGGARVQAVSGWLGMGHRRRPATMYIKERDAACDYTVYRTNDGSLKSECVCGGIF